jgi:hypothetical protein
MASVNSNPADAPLGLPASMVMSKGRPATALSGIRLTPAEGWSGAG